METSAPEILRSLSAQISEQHVTSILVKNDEVVEAALQTLRQSDFNPCHSLAVSFSRIKTSQWVGSQHRFLSVLLQKLQTTSIFEGPTGVKNLALNSHGKIKITNIL